MLYLVCHENGGYITNGMLFNNHEDAIAEIRRRREAELAERTSNDPTDGYWIAEDSCCTHPSGWGYVSITRIPDENIHGTGPYYPVSFDNGGCVDDVSLWSFMEDARKDIDSRVSYWNQTNTCHDSRMEKLNDCHYDNGDGFGFILGDKLEVTK